MPKPLALVTRMDAATEAVWKETLTEALPEETILAFHEMSENQRRESELAIVANPDPADVAELLNIQWIHSLWAGVERLVAELGPGVVPIVRLVDPELARVMAEAVLAWTFYLQRDMPAYRTAQEKAQWAPRDYRHPRDVTVGLLGLGELGKAAADRLKAAGFNVIGWSRSPKTLGMIETLSGESGFEHVLAASDILVCLMPLTEDTRGMLNSRRFARMKPGAAIINFARGPIVVDADLIAALDAGQLSHAVLDVFAEEPLPASSALWAHPSITVLPHISGPTDRFTAAGIVAANIRNWRQTGNLPKTVDIKAGY
ncbi:2-hydroxyacid dehydrogenase [Endobacterium cereale]|uniref:2-hydroxyacid dehydrogenase n=1 Tax=Endobacterium cereale TaxID=2663029 RepID=UPI002B49BB38|nr:glyoxylate/hydroxypyruvate reductase A [Endobacterium cereale]MEB2847256.1 glyoxylate/hydroxypyruvate reductase A [Endobacterium cereale]